MTAPRREAAVTEQAHEAVEQLIERARKGDLDAFDELFVTFEPRVLRMAYHMVGNPDEAADVAQEVFVRIYKYLGKIRDSSKFSTWLYRLVVHASYDYLRRYRMGEAISLDDDQTRPLKETVADDQVSVEHTVVYRDLGEKLLDSLGVLTPSERSVFVLRDVEGFEVKEIAKIHGISAITVRRHLSTARHKLREVVRGLRMNASAAGRV
jgi:RNA polymerase sigma-70 factor (ECF subfamily)